MDDRFDFILVSSSILGETDVNYLENSYTPYGNDGDHLNQSINAGNNSAVPDEIADALYVASDHLPVYLDIVFSGTLPPLRQIVISEIMPDPGIVSGSNGEWFEVYNTDSVTIDFAGWTIKDAGTDEHLISTQEGSLLIEPEEYFVFGRNGNQNENGGYEADYEYGNTMLLGNTVDEIILLDPEGRVVDEVYYTNAFPSSSGTSMYVLDLLSNNNIVSNWAESTTPFGLGDLGTPGEPSPSMSSSTLTIPHKIHLFQNYPNPFNSMTTLSYEISESGYMQLAIFNLSGQEVEILEEGLKHPGIFHVYWKTDILPSGVYVSQLVFDDQILSKKLVLLK
jgi:hypothetical protein